MVIRLFLKKSNEFGQISRLNWAFLDHSQNSLNILSKYYKNNNCLSMFANHLKTKQSYLICLAMLKICTIVYTDQAGTRGYTECRIPNKDCQKDLFSTDIYPNNGHGLSFQWVHTPRSPYATFQQREVTKQCIKYNQSAFHCANCRL